MTDANVDAVKRAALAIVHRWMVEADNAPTHAPAEPEEAAQLPEGSDFDPTDLGDTHNLYQALWRFPRWPYYRSEIPWAVERLAEARREYAELARRRGPSAGAGWLGPLGACIDDELLEAMLE